MMTRRAFSAAGFASMAAALSGCTGADAAGQFEQAKAYLDAGINAVTAAGQQYLASTPAPLPANAAIVQQALAGLATLQSSLAGTTVPANWKSGALQALAFIQQLTPIVTVFLGGAAPYIPMVIAIVQAFVNGLPTPAEVPPTPPAALRRKGAERR